MGFTEIRAGKSGGKFYFDSLVQKKNKMAAAVNKRFGFFYYQLERRKTRQKY